MLHSHAGFVALAFGDVAFNGDEMSQLTPFVVDWLALDADPGTSGRSWYS